MTEQPVDMVNHPPHYRRGPLILLERKAGTRIGTGEWVAKTLHDGANHYLRLECISVIRHIRDMRLATAVKYIWRVAFGGKADDREDIAKAIWYLQDWLDNPIEGDR